MHAILSVQATKWSVPVGLLLEDGPKDIVAKVFWLTVGQDNPHNIFLLNVLIILNVDKINIKMWSTEMLRLFLWILYRDRVCQVPRSLRQVSEIVQHAVRRETRQLWATIQFCWISLIFLWRCFPNMKNFFCFWNFTCCSLACVYGLMCLWFDVSMVWCVYGL